MNGADTDNNLWNQPEAARLNAIGEGFRHLGYKNDHEIIAAESLVYHALYAHCQEMVRRGKPETVCFTHSSTTLGSSKGVPERRPALAIVPAEGIGTPFIMRYGAGSVPVGYLPALALVKGA